MALKEIRPDRAANPELWRRFLKEAQVTGQLEHPNIVPVYELARRKEDDQPFYTMRLSADNRSGGPSKSSTVSEPATSRTGWRSSRCWARS